jgi:hypothetical protein
MLYIFLLSIFLVALSILLLGFRVFFTENGKFPNTHVGENKKLKEKGIGCMNCQDLQEQNKKNIFELSNCSKCLKS